MEFTVRKTRPEDLDRLTEIYAYARELMRCSGNPNQWIVHPRRELLESDIVRGCGYVLEAEGTICGTFAYLTGEDPTYAVIEDGAWLNDRPYGTIHRIASAGIRRGVLEAAVRFGLSQVPNLRIDTHRDNRIMQNALNKLGFTRCGIIYCKADTGDHSPRIAYQKTLEAPEPLIER